MPNNPVQIILNDTDFHRAPDPKLPPRPKDFFEKHDKEFDKHKKELLYSIDKIIEFVDKCKYGNTVYVKVQMKEDALAKSYRPVHWLFKPDQFPCVGAEAVGTLYFRATKIHLPALRRRIEEAETTVRVAIRKRDQKPYLAPTISRMEVGAIDSIKVAPPSEKRRFSAAEAMRLFSDPCTISGYQIDLFEPYDPYVIASDFTGRGELYRSLSKLFLEFGDGSRAQLTTRVGRTPIFELLLTDSNEPARIGNRIGVILGENKRSVPNSINLDINRHEKVLSMLQSHPLVRSIRPPLQLQLDNENVDATTYNVVEIPNPSENSKYPIVGIIDSGVKNPLNSWVVEKFDYLFEDEYDGKHGTGVSGLITIGQRLNNSNIAPEPDGCKIYDIPLFPKHDFHSHYPDGFSQFLNEVEQAVSEAKEKYNVRIFNLSINAISNVERFLYSPYAAELDRISDEYGVIFVNSAGNLSINDVRAPWPKKTKDVIGYLAKRMSSDVIYKPAESVRSISVGALNPPTNSPKHIDFAPTTYTRRGPGLQVGVKPDVATFGGVCISKAGEDSGLYSINTNGEKTPVVGTSYSAPLISRTLAELDSVTNGNLQCEALRAMIIHSAVMPPPLTKRGLKDISRQFAGFGRPKSSKEMLETDDNQITLLFQSRLQIGEKKPAILRFPFTWPKCLVSEGGKCSGQAKITLVYAPPLDPAFGAEFVRINLEASLKQRQQEPDKNGNPRFLNQIDAKFLPNKAGLAVPEKALIDHGLKWWPTKQYCKNFNEVGVSSEWRLEVSSLIRAEAEFPAEGVPFAVLLTLEDPHGIAPVFQEMRQSLQSSIANAQSLSNAFRIQSRN